MAYKFISVERMGDVFVITLRKPPENRLNVEACQELIRGEWNEYQARNETEFIGFVAFQERLIRDRCLNSISSS
jgi:hypothetical protein